MLAFKTHLKKLKTQLFEFNQKYKIMIFLAKLKQNLKFKILNIDSVSHLRKNLLTLIIMQKKIMKRDQRKADVVNVNHQFKNNKNFNENHKSNENKSENKFDRNADAELARTDDKFNNSRDNSKSFKKSKNEIEDKRFNCFICEKSRH